MIKVLWFVFLLIAITSCEKNSDFNNNYHIAKVVGYDLNCSTCILSFPYDSTLAVKKFGASDSCFYQSVNLRMNNFEIGQLINVNVRKAFDNEINSCVTLYPSHNYSKIFVSDYEPYRDFIYNDTIDLGYGKCLMDYSRQIKICFDSVIADSRCPENVICIWAGEAMTRFKITIGNNEHYFIDLRNQTTDTLINGYKFSFVDLLPYPNTKYQRSLSDYVARIVIKK